MGSNNNRINYLSHLIRAYNNDRLGCYYKGDQSNKQCKGTLYERWGLLVIQLSDGLKRFLVVYPKQSSSRDFMVPLPCILVQCWGYYIIMVEHNLPIVVSRLFNYPPLDKRRSFLSLFKRIPVIQPDSRAWIAWRIILTICIIFFMFDITLLLTFGQQFWGDQQKLITFRVFYFIGVGITGLDMFLQFHVGYYQRGVLHKNRKDIFEKKVLFVFTVDVVTLIILILSFFIYNWELAVLRAIYFIKLIRLKDLNKQFRDLCLLHRRVRLTYEICKITLIFILYCHIIGCIFYGVDLLIYNNNGSYVQNQYLWILDCPAYPNIIAEPWDIKYLYSFYWAISSTSTVGYGDIYPKNPVGNFLIVLSNISICIIFGIFARSIITAFQSYNQVSINLKEQLTMLKEYFQFKRISTQLSRKIRRFIEFKSILEGMKEESKIEDFKSKLSPQIKSKLCFVLYKSFLTQLPLIKDEEKLMELSLCIQEQTFFEGEVMKNMNGERCIYFVKQGYVLSYYQLQRSIYQTGILSVKNKFKTYEYFSGFKSSKSYKFVTHSEILVLQGDLLFQSINKQKLSEVKMDLLVYGDTYSLGITCSVCQQYHLEHNCTSLFLQKTHRLSGREEIQNHRSFKLRKSRRFRITEGIGSKSVREPINIDRVCNFKKYYPNYNILV